MLRKNSKKTKIKKKCVTKHGKQKTKSKKQKTN